MKTISIILITSIFMIGFASKIEDYNKYDLEDYPDIPTIGGQKLEKYKKFEKIYFEDFKSTAKMV